MMTGKVEDIIIDKRRNSFGWFGTVGFVDGFVVRVISDYKPTKAQAYRMLQDKQRRNMEQFRIEMAALIK